MIFEILQEMEIPVAYGHFNSGQKPPFMVYMGAGQNTFSTDDVWTFRRNEYRIEYYFTKKDEELEDELEELLLENGYNYTKSEDVFINEEDVFVIYYDI